MALCEIALAATPVVNIALTAFPPNATEGNMSLYEGQRVRFTATITDVNSNPFNPASMTVSINQGGSPIASGYYPGGGIEQTLSPEEPFAPVPGSWYFDWTSTVNGAVTAVWKSTPTNQEAVQELAIFILSQ